MNKKKWNLAPYLLILPSFIYLAVFFAWPMLRSLQLAFMRDSQILPVLTEPDPEADVVGRLEMQTQVAVVDRVQSEEVLASTHQPNTPRSPVRPEAIDRGWTHQKNVSLSPTTPRRRDRRR